MQIIMGGTQSASSADASLPGQPHHSSDDIPYTSYSVDRNGIRGMYAGKGPVETSLGFFSSRLWLQIHNKLHQLRHSTWLTLCWSETSELKFGTLNRSSHDTLCLNHAFHNGNRRCLLKEPEPNHG